MQGPLPNLARLTSGAWPHDVAGHTFARRDMILERFDNLIPDIVKFSAQITSYRGADSGYVVRVGVQPRAKGVVSLCCLDTIQ